MTMSFADESAISWRDDKNDLPHRRKVIRQVSKLLRDRKEDPDPKWLRQLPFKAKKLEEHMYKNAPSLEVYADEKTIKQRLKKAAVSIARQLRIERAYRSGLWTRPSPRASIVSSIVSSIGSTSPVSGFSSNQRRSSTEDVLKVPNQLLVPQSPASSPTNLIPSLPESPLPSIAMSTSSMWDAAASSTTNLWDVPIRRNDVWENTADASTNASAPPQGVTANSTVVGISELQAANERLQNDILANIRRQQDALRTLAVSRW